MLEWSGYGISGHIFLITLMSNMAVETREATDVLWRYFVSLLLDVWIVEFSITAIYFHSFPEKVSTFASMFPDCDAY